MSVTATFTSTIQTEFINMKPKAPKRKRATKTTKTPTASTNIEKDDMETITEVDDKLDFEMQIESTNNNSIFEDDEVATTIAEQIMRSHKQLPPKEHRFVMTNMEEVNKEVHCDDTITQLTVQNKYTKTESLLGLLQKLDLPSHWIRLISSFYIHEHAKDIKAISSKESYGRLLSLGNRMLSSCMKQLCPGPGGHDVQSTILSMMTTQVERTYQKLQKDQQRMMKKDLKQTYNAYKRSASEKLNSVVCTLCSWSNKSVKWSLEQRLLQAVLNDSFLRHKIVDKIGRAHV